jgi:hypothetical protein
MFVAYRCAKMSADLRQRLLTFFLQRLQSSEKEERLLVVNTCLDLLVQEDCPPSLRSQMEQSPLLAVAATELPPLLTDRDRATALIWLPPACYTAELADMADLVGIWLPLFRPFFRADWMEEEGPARLLHTLLRILHREVRAGRDWQSSQLGAAVRQLGLAPFLAQVLASRETAQKVLTHSLNLICQLVQENHMRAVLLSAGVFSPDIFQPLLLDSPLRIQLNALEAISWLHQCGEEDERRSLILTYDPL